MLFTYNRVSLCFLMIVGIEPTAFCLIDRRSTNELYRTYCDVLTQLLHKVLLYTIQHTTYLLSCELLSSLLRSVYPRLSTDPLTTQTAYEPLGATPWTNTLPFLILINWTGLVVKSAPPVTFHRLKFPLRACKPTFFPQHPASLLQPPVLSVIATSR